ncbi:tryptophan halogenase family protein [Streptomyces sporangiiformans]|uniref:Tryptophan 7-halogenase n=1 Tax=Streptomyces sporangiiformans TaxID=2315329 RepID=A0A505DH06_9ACTN|nr:tryptophan halogenase family protein [Streptomyces sporangiiformans]TPQ22180.1 tryptophan 7-halogenase [Streptomyces sporangiiformans]
MSTQNPENVVIVGGGIAGSMTAAYLKAAFRERISVTLVEDESGSAAAENDETTLGDIRSFFDFLGLEEEDWMPACDATYKLAVRFQDWNRPEQHFYLPFEDTREVGGFPLTEWWLHNGPSGRFDRDCFVAAWLCDAGRSPRQLGGSPAGLGDASAGPDDAPAGWGGAAGPYGYHFEAGALARYLTGYAVGRGVRYLADEVLEVRLDARGWIEHVVTKEHGEIHGDLFVDCTGDRGLLLHKALKVPYVSYQDTLPNDSVVTLRVPTRMKARGIPPYTTVAARGAGWIWTIPLFSRIGTGYVYAREYCTPEEAERTLRESVGPEAAGVEADHAPLLVGRSLRAWQHNCVAVGAPGGRVEPLEATGASFVHHALEQLVRHFPAADWHPKLRDSYNASVSRVMDGAREFLALHYHGAARDHTQYWRDAKTRPVPDALAERIARWRVRPPGAELVPPYHQGLPPHAYASLLLGTGAIPLRPSTAITLVDDTAARREFAAVRDEAQGLVGTLPTPYEYITQMSLMSG